MSPSFEAGLSLGIFLGLIAGIFLQPYFEYYLEKFGVIGKRRERE